MPSGREQQFLTLVRENDARLRRICRVYAHDVESRRDLYQEMMLQLWRSLPSFTGASTMETWVYRVALNTALSQLRRRPAHAETPLDDENADTTPDFSLGRLDESVVEREQADRLYVAIEHMNGVDRMLVTMYLDDRSYREMADVIGISESNVGVKLHRIRKALAKLLTEEPV